MNQFRYQAGVKGRGLTARRRLQYAVRTLLTAPVLLFEIPAILGRRRINHHLANQFMNDLCNATQGKGLDIGNRVICMLRTRQTRLFDKEQRPNEEILSTVPLHQIDELVEELKANGFIRLPQYLSLESAIRMRAKIQTANGRDAIGNFYTDVFEWSVESTSGRFNTADNAVAEATSAENLNFSALTLIARKFIGASPQMLGPHSWTTTFREHETDLQIEENAMAYHCDSDFFGFLKVFLILTDVQMENGPFTFIRGSHRGKRHVQGRVANEVLNIQPNEEMFGTGQPGDVVLAATKGWHKATPPREGTRMMVQWIYSNGLFGSTTQ
jgi:hypothetical protein